MTDDYLDEVRRAYDAGAEAWTRGPERVYRRLADALVAESPLDLAGRLVLDLGSGTGVASAALSNAGALPIGLDVAHAMLAQRRTDRPPGAAGSALALPVRDASFDGVVAAFCINHFPEPRDALREARRVLRPGGLLLASSFSASDQHPAKTAVEDVLVRHGYERPSWYAAFKDRATAATGSPGALAAAAEAVGFVEVLADEIHPAAGLDEAAAMVSWRLSMPQTIGWVEGLGTGERAALRADALAAVTRLDPPTTIAVVVLRARAPA